MEKVIRAFGIVATVTLLVSPLAMSTPEYSKKEQKKCTFCHTAMGKPDLNEAGKYYKEHDHSLRGFRQQKRP